MKKMILSLIAIFGCLSLWANDVDVEVSPPDPVVGETFYLTFKIKSSSEVDPQISFNPGQIQVLGKREQGVSISTTVINGKFTTTREQNYVYEMVAENTGLYSIRDIKVDMDGKIQRLSDVRFNVLREPKRAAEVFLEARPAKTKVYVGEGIDVEYYLFYKVPITANDIKEFPKLNKFIKRFHQVSMGPETVQYGREIYKRLLLYSARVYALKPGKAIIDPMKISVQILSDYGNSVFGMGGSSRTKDVSNPKVEIEILPIPSENVPAGFTGLVGDHDFVLTGGKEKYLVNEPIEMKLEVTGPGALESFEAPKLYEDPNLEEFDAKAELKETSKNTAKKTFDYTYLARSATKINQRQLSLFYFDPNSGKFIEKKINIPSVEVSGTAAPTISKNEDSKHKNENSQKNTDGKNVGESFDFNFSIPKFLQFKSRAPELSPPIFEANSSTRSFGLTWVIVGIELIIIGFLLKSFQTSVFSKKIPVEATMALKALQKKMTYEDLYLFLDAILLGKKEDGLEFRLKASHLKEDCFDYFSKLLKSTAEEKYGKTRAIERMKFDKKMFKSVIKNYEDYQKHN